MITYHGIKPGSRKLYPTEQGYRASVTHIVKNVSNHRQIWNLAEIPKLGDPHPDEPSIFVKDFDPQVIDETTITGTSVSEWVEVTVSYGPPSGRIEFTPHLQSVSWSIAAENRHVDLDAFGNVVGSPYLYSNNNGQNPPYPPGYGQANILAGTPLVITDFLNRPIPSGRDEDAKLGYDILIPSCEASVTLPISNTWFNPVTSSQNVLGKYNSLDFVLDGYTIPKGMAVITKVNAEDSSVQSGNGGYIKRVTLSIKIGYQEFPPPNSFPFGYRNPDWTPYLINGQAPNSTVPVRLPQQYDCFPTQYALNKPPVDINGNADATAKTPFKWQIADGDSTKIFLALDKDRVAAKSAAAMIVFKKVSGTYDFNLIGLT